MKNGSRVIIGLFALAILAIGRMVMMNNNIERNRYQEELSNEIRNHAMRDANKGEFVGSAEGSQLLKESFEREQEYNVQQKQKKQIESNTNSSSKRITSQENEAVVIRNLDTWVKEKFAPMIDRSTETVFNAETSEVSIVFVTKLYGGKKLVGSTYLIGSMEESEERHYFKPIKWREDHKETKSVNEYLLKDVDYIDSNNKLKTGNLKAYWDWGFNGSKPFYFEEE